MAGGLRFAARSGRTPGRSRARPSWGEQRRRAACAPAPGALPLCAGPHPHPLFAPRERSLQAKTCPTSPPPGPRAVPSSPSPPPRYRETVSLHEELVVLSASGTAVRIRIPDEEMSKREASLLPHAPFSGASQYAGHLYGAPYGRASGSRRMPPPCTIGHTPYSPAEAPFPVRIEPCAMCKRKHVPELLLATIDKPPWLPALGDPCLIQVGRWRPVAAGGRGVEGGGKRAQRQGRCGIGRARAGPGLLWCRVHEYCYGIVAIGEERGGVDALLFTSRRRLKPPSTLPTLPPPPPPHRCPPLAGARLPAEEAAAGRVARHVRFAGAPVPRVRSAPAAAAQAQDTRQKRPLRPEAGCHCGRDTHGRHR